MKGIENWLYTGSPSASGGVWRLRTWLNIGKLARQYCSGPLTWFGHHLFLDAICLTWKTCQGQMQHLLKKKIS